MPVLLLCYGDKEAKDLLRQGIEARYGSSPPVIDSLTVTFKGRARVKVGPITTWVPVETVTHFRFPTHIRWDFTVKPLGLAVQRGIESYDGEKYLSTRGRNAPTVITDDSNITSIRRRLWAMAAILLTPLSDTTIKVTNVDANCFEANNTKLNDAVTLCFRANRMLEHVRVQCLNPDTNREQIFKMQLSEELQLINGLMLPTKITASWDSDVSFEMEPVQSESNPQLNDDIFTLDSENIAS